MNFIAKFFDLASFEFFGLFPFFKSKTSRNLSKIAKGVSNFSKNKILLTVIKVLICSSKSMRSFGFRFKIEEIGMGKGNS